MKKRFDLFINVVGVMVVVAVLGIIVLGVWSSTQVDQAMSRMPFVVITSGQKPYYYCERIDSEVRVAYNCIPSGTVFLVVYPEYHLAATDSWLKR